MSYLLEEVKPIESAPKNGSPVQLWFQDVRGKWGSINQYRWIKGAWTSTNGLPCPTSLKIVGWRHYR